VVEMVEKLRDGKFFCFLFLIRDERPFCLVEMRNERIGMKDLNPKCLN